MKTKRSRLPVRSVYLPKRSVGIAGGRSTRTTLGGWPLKIVLRLSAAPRRKSLLKKTKPRVLSYPERSRRANQRLRNFVLMSLWLYILECSDGTLYTGVTNNLDRRFAEHQHGINPEAYTYSRRPVKLVFAEEYWDYRLAYDWERRIKQWSAKKKRALIEGNWEQLKKLAQCMNASHWLNGDNDDFNGEVR